MDGVASTKVEADAELEQLRTNKGFVGNEPSSPSLIEDLDKALDIISDQLYQTPTHFLLELIQNADDNSYASGVLPSFHLSLYEKGDQKYLHTSCNEVGFTFKQLDALTRIGHSTKIATAGEARGYIGEKGIGFKSVFKVADVVHIASGFYEFRLDRNKPIGMILPILSRFPSAERDTNETQFLLELRSQNYYNIIRQNIEDIEPELLMFLQKLVQIRVYTPDARKVYRRRINGSDEEFGGETVTISEFNEKDGSTKNTKYVVHRYTVQQLPSEPRRMGITTSEVVVAFAVKNQVTPIATVQKAFAFLPIDNFGFRFLIHADFLLVASRESLELECPWNISLRDGVCAAVVNAIHALTRLPKNDDGEGLCYTWPAYLARASGSSSFWNSLHQDILNRLRYLDILESRDMMTLWQKPNALRAVPKEYRFNGKTLFGLPSIERLHLSFSYDSVMRPLRLISVSTLTIDELCDQFEAWIKEVGDAGIGKQSSEWHRKVSAVFCHSERLKGRLKLLQIIPLRGGTWVNAMEQHVYLAPKDEEEHVPAGINISIVDSNASQDPTRRMFFNFLGIQEYSPRQVCKLIVELHSGSSIRRRLEDVVTDVIYLFEHTSYLRGYGAPNIFYLCTKARNTYYAKSQQIYIIDHTDASAVINKYQNYSENPFAVLSNRYSDAIHKSKAGATVEMFQEWLLRSEISQFTTVPTLVRDTSVTDEWNFLRDQDVVDLLEVVKYHWENNNRPLEFHTAVPELKIRCLDGVTRALGLLAVPTMDLKQECPYLWFARLPNPTLDRWGFLSNFGVVTTCSTTAKLRELEALSELPADDIDNEVVHTIYRALSHDSDKERIRKAFGNRPLVFIIKPKPRWQSHNTCVWTAPVPLKQVIDLAIHYRDCRTLFRDILKVRPASTKHVVDEFCSISKASNQAVQRFKEMFLLLGDYHDKSHINVRQYNMIQSAPVFPILEKTGDSQEEPNVVMRSIRDKDWYIPDNATLYSAFRGKIDMLNLSVKLVREFRSLFTDLHCEEVLLSSAVKEEVESNGMSVRDELREISLETRLKYISQLLPVDSGFMETFPKLRVWSVPSITVRWRLGDVEAGHDKELVTIKENDKTTDIYLREDLQGPDQDWVTSKLLEHFVDGFQDIKGVSLLALLMNAPMSQLPDIMEKHNFSPLKVHDDGGSADEETDREGSDEDDSDTGIMDQTEDAPNSGLSNEVSDNYHGERSFRGLNDTSKMTDSDREAQSLSRFAPMRTNFPKPLQELIPSHPSRIKKIAQKASEFWMSDSLTAKSPSKSYGSESVFRQSLPIRNRNIDHDSEGGSASGRVNPPVISSGSSGNAYTPKTSERHFVDYQTPPSVLVSDDAPSSTWGSPISARDIRYKAIGFNGEFYVYEVFRHQVADWTVENWTSKLRAEAGHPCFDKDEKFFSDFTYLDSFGYMKEALRKAGVEPGAEWSKNTRFHLEVKSTLDHCSEVFFISQSQLDMMRRYDGDPNNAYILLRIFQLEEEDGPNIKFFRDPWSLYVNGNLYFRSKEGYRVYQERNPEQSTWLSD